MVKEKWVNTMTICQCNRANECHSNQRHIMAAVHSFTHPTITGKKQLAFQITSNGNGKGKVHPCTGTEALYRPYGP